MPQWHSQCIMKNIHRNHFLTWINEIYANQRLGSSF